MDLLFKRYASPFLILDSYIENGSLTSFLRTLYEKVGEERMWEVWLHKVDNQSFDEFKNSIVEANEKVDNSTDTINDILSNSLDISRNNITL